MFGRPGHGTGGGGRAGVRVVGVGFTGTVADVLQRLLVVGNEDMLVTYSDTKLPHPKIVFVTIFETQNLNNICLKS